MKQQEVVSDLLARTRAILDTMVDGVITISDRGAIETANPAAESIFGYSCQELYGKNVAMLMPRPYCVEHDQYIKNYLESGEKKIIGIGREVTGLRRDGSTFPLELAISEMEVNGRRMFTGIVRDISQRKETEEKLREAMRYVHEQRIKDEFIATVSHELRTPLTSIKASLELIANHAVGDIPEQASQLINIALKNSGRLLLLINDILDISKLESQQSPFHFRRVKLCQFLESCISSNQSYAEKHGVKFLMGRCPAECKIDIDPDRMMQVLSNLMSNAAKFSKPGSVVAIYAAPYNQGLRITVKDDGDGIPPEFHRRIFEKFTQAKHDSNREISGTGLGLYISKAIVEKHNASLSFQSLPKQGTEFYIDFPASSVSNVGQH